MANTEQKASTQVFCFMAANTPSMAPTTVPKITACNPSCTDGPMRLPRSVATGWSENCREMPKSPWRMLPR